MSENSKASWGCGPDPLHDGTERIVNAMRQDPDILRVYFIPFFHHGGGWDLWIETVEGVDAIKKMRFYWEEFL